MTATTINFPSLSNFGVVPVGPDPFQSYEAISLMKLAKEVFGFEKAEAGLTLETIGVKELSLYQETQYTDGEGFLDMSLFVQFKTNTGMVHAMFLLDNGMDGVTYRITTTGVGWDEEGFYSQSYSVFDYGWDGVFDTVKESTTWVNAGVYSQQDYQNGFLTYSTYGSAELIGNATIDMSTWLDG